jgi:hypothetical protein
MHIKGRFVSCWRHSDGRYHLVVSDGAGGGDVIAIHQPEVIAILGSQGNSNSVDFDIYNKEAQPDT